MISDPRIFAEKHLPDTQPERQQLSCVLDSGEIDAPEHRGVVPDYALC